MKVMKVREGRYGFPVMQDIIPEGKSGNCAIEYFSISESEARLEAIRGTYNRDCLGRDVYAGDFVRLKVDGSLVMSDSDGERASNRMLVWESHGNVLIAGLGIGMILTKIVPKPEVSKVVVVELEQDVINLVEPHIRNYLGYDSAKLEIVKGDIYSYIATMKFNTIYFDIWGNYSGDDYEKTKVLHRKYSRYLDRTNHPYMDSWMRWHMKDLHFGR